MKKVSVILVTCDRPQLFSEALDSLCAQTFRDFEVVVADTGTKPIHDIVEAYKAKLAVHYVRTPVRIPPEKNRNLALAVAEGEWIAYLDDDDLFLPNHLESLMHHAAGGKAEFIYSGCRKIYYTYTNSIFHVVREELVNSAFDPARLARENFIPVITALHARSLVTRFGAFDDSVPLTPLEDWEMWIRFAAQGVQFVCTGTPTALYRIGVSSNKTYQPQSEILARNALAHIMKKHHLFIASKLNPAQQDRLKQKIEGVLPVLGVS